MWLFIAGFITGGILGMVLMALIAGKEKDETNRD